MKRIIITRPDFFDGEANAIEAMLDNGADRVHIRKPGASAEAIEALVRSIRFDLRIRLSLHDHTELAMPLGVGGVHLNSRNPEVPAGFWGIVSRSCHSIEELARPHDGIAYSFLSPVFDSISKKGYTHGFDIAELAEAASRGIIGPDVYALGGVHPGNFRRVNSLGFGGAALLGAAWQPVDPSSFRLQYITQGDTIDTVVNATRAALQGGCRWVQLRMKDAAEADILKAAAALADMCAVYGATFLLDDHVELVEAAGAHGVHLGRNDMPVAEARKILGPAYIIGATANTSADIIAAATAGADYCGLGPLRFTTTKKNLSPVLGYEGTAAVIAQAREAGVTLPVVSIGGITPADIAPLTQAGASGIAVSGAIANAPEPRLATEEFIRQLKT